MKSTEQIQLKIHTQESLLKQVNAWRVLNKKIVFTSGFFDVLTKDDILLFNEAASFGDMLIVGIYDDASIAKQKGSNQTINEENSRALVLACLLQTDAIVIFKEEHALELIKQIMPNILVNASNSTLEKIIGAKEISESEGGIKIINIDADMTD
jgi:D-glycero-beta-D-manno-heptose 1-phosphate adenylyltransferase